MNRHVSCLLFAVFGAAANAGLIAPDSAVAGSQFSGLYDIGNAIDGSGLPGGFSPADQHADYVTNNHWTTASGAIGAGNAWAEFSFTSPQTVGTFYMWNHRSNNIASNATYGVLRFNLILKDAGDNTVGSLMNQSSLAHVATAQTFVFGLTNNVKKARFEILQNGTTSGTSSYTGLAEVRFDTTAVPEPMSIVALAGGALVLLRRRKAK